MLLSELIETLKGIKDNYKEANPEVFISRELSSEIMSLSINAIVGVDLSEGDKVLLLLNTGSNENSFIFKKEEILDKLKLQVIEH